MRHIVVLVALVLALVACKHSSARANDDSAPLDSGPIDPAEQAAAYDMQCVGGNLESCRALATMYLEGKGVLQDLRRATQLFAQACTGSNMSACNSLALAYAEGIGIDKNPKLATDTYERACNGNYFPACRNLGLLLRDGRGVPADPVKAGVLLDKACRGGVPFACTNAGDLDASLAVKTPARWKQSFAHYKQGCEKGDPTGCRQLGIAYLEGKGVPKSPNAAAVWLERACLPDDPIACRLLGAQLLQGNGVPKNPERGKQLLQRACDAKDGDACKQLESLNESPDAPPTDAH